MLKMLVTFSSPLKLPALVGRSTLLLGPLTPDGNTCTILGAAIVEVKVEARVGVDPTMASGEIKASSRFIHLKPSLAMCLSTFMYHPNSWLHDLISTKCRRRTVDILLGDDSLVIASLISLDGEVLAAALAAESPLREDISARQ